MRHTCHEWMPERRKNVAGFSWTSVMWIDKFFYNMRFYIINCTDERCACVSVDVGELINISILCLPVFLSVPLLTKR